MADVPFDGVPEAVQPNPAAQILGRQWAITPLTWSWMRAGSDQGPIHLLVLETPLGRLAFGFNEQDLEAFIRTAQTQLTGLVLPTNDFRL